MSRKNVVKTPKTYVAFGAERTIVSVPNQSQALVAAGVCLIVTGLVVLAFENQ